MARWWQVLAVVAVAALAFGGGLLFLSHEDDETPGAGGGFFTPAPAGSPAPVDSAGLVAQAAERGCAARALTDPAYQVTVETEPDPPRVEGTTFRLRVTRDGRPVEGARVCLLAAMTEMSHAGVSEETREVAPGLYEGQTSFAMRGDWSGRVKVIETGQPAVGIPFGLDVQ